MFQEKEKDLMADEFEKYKRILKREDEKFKEAIRAEVSISLPSNVLIKLLLMKDTTSTTHKSLLLSAMHTVKGPGSIFNRLTFH